MHLCLTDPQLAAKNLMRFNLNVNAAHTFSRVEKRHCHLPVLYCFEKQQDKSLVSFVYRTMSE